MTPKPPTPNTLDGGGSYVYEPKDASESILTLEAGDANGFRLDLIEGKTIFFALLEGTTTVFLDLFESSTAICFDLTEGTRAVCLDLILGS